MRNVNKIQSPKEQDMSGSWVKSGKFNNRSVKYHRGKDLTLLYKYERTYSGLERVGRAFLATAAVVLTLGAALLSSSVQDLYTKKKKNIRFGVDKLTMDRFFDPIWAKVFLVTLNRTDYNNWIDFFKQRNPSDLNKILNNCKPFESIGLNGISNLLYLVNSCMDCKQITDTELVSVMSIILLKMHERIKLFNSNQKLSGLSLPEVVLYANLIFDLPSFLTAGQREAIAQTILNCQAIPEETRKKFENFGASNTSSAEPQKANAYAILGIKEGAGKREIKRAYKKLIISSHPDKVNGTPEQKRIAEARFIEIQQAFEMLNPKS